jgi:hypothetical protein
MRPLEGPIGWEASYQFEFEADGQDGWILPKANYEVVTQSYFETVGTPLLEGRDFDDHDSEDAEPVVIISRTLADRIRAAGYTPLGLRMRLRNRSSPWRRVVGICSDAHYRHITRRSTDVFVPYLQVEQVTKYVVIRGSQPAPELSALARRALAEIDSNQAVGNVATIGELIDRATATYRFNMIVLLWFGVCAVILVAAGVVSVIAETVAARRQEIAIRSALGGQTHQLVRDVVSRTLQFALAGQVLGAFAVAALGTVDSEVFHGVLPHDPVVLGTVMVFLFIVSLAAASLPAWRAAEGDLKTALRAS